MISVLKGLDPQKIVHEIQPIAFDNAVWLTSGSCSRKGLTDAKEIAVELEKGIQSFGPGVLLIWRSRHWTRRACSKATR